MPDPDRDLFRTALPSSLTPLLMPYLSEVAQKLMDAARHDVPVYAAPLEGPLREEIRSGVEAALTRFLELPGSHEPALQEEDRRVYDGLGRAEVHQGRLMDALFAVYRSGARTTLRSLSRLAVDAGFEASVLIALTESVFAYIEELSAVSAQGYAAEQSERAGERDRLRDTVADMLIRGHGDEEAVRAAAAAAGWTVPERVVMVSLAADQRTGLRSRLGESALLTSRPGTSWRWSRSPPAPPGAGSWNGSSPAEGPWWVLPGLGVRHRTPCGWWYSPGTCCRAGPRNSKNHCG